MNALLKSIFTSVDHPSRADIIRWWEQRRIYYNIIMLIAGLITISLALLLHEIPLGDLMNALPPILVVALCANLFYSLGWVTELACHRFIAEKAFVQKAGPILFIAGVVLSIFFTFAIDIAIIITFVFGN